MYFASLCVHLSLEMMKHPASCSYSVYSSVNLFLTFLTLLSISAVENKRSVHFWLLSCSPLTLDPRVSVTRPRGVQGLREKNKKWDREGEEGTVGALAHALTVATVTPSCLEQLSFPRHSWICPHPLWPGMTWNGMLKDVQCSKYSLTVSWL